MNYADTQPPVMVITLTYTGNLGNDMCAVGQALGVYARKVEAYQKYKRQISSNLAKRAESLAKIKQLTAKGRRRFRDGRVPSEWVQKIMETRGDL